MKIGFIGLGIMGESMCENIVKKHDDTVYCFDFIPAKVELLASKGAVPCKDSVELAEKSDVIISMVPKSEHSMSVYKTILPVLGAGKTCIDMSTIDPSVSVEISKMVKATGAAFMDAPVVKSKPAAIAGKLGIYMGGDEATCEAMRPILAYMGENIIRMGDNGKGLVMKICHNALVTQIQNGVNETLSLAQLNGISVEDYATAISYGGGQNFYLDGQWQKLRDEDYTTAFSLANAAKDVGICIVENMTGGDGFAAATYFADDSTSVAKELLVFGYGLCYRHDLGKEFGTEEVDFDRSAMFPIGTVDDRTWIVYTTPDQSLASILEKAKNGGIKMSGGNPLSDCHLELGSLLALEGGKVSVVPYDGGANQKKGLTDGEVDVFVGTTQAAKDEVEAGTLIPILAISDKAFEGFVTPNGPITVPTVAGDAKAPELSKDIDFSSCILPAGGTLAVHKGADQGFIDEMTSLMKDVWNEPEYNEWIASILLNRFELYGDEAEAFIDEACEKAINAYKNLSGQA